EGFELLCRTEGIIPALESAHAVAYLRRLLPQLPSGSVVVVCLSGRGDKDVAEVARLRGRVAGAPATAAGDGLMTRADGGAVCRGSATVESLDVPAGTVTPPGEGGR